MKILVVGASGMVGWNCVQVAQSLGHETLGTFHTFPLPGLVPLALDSEPAVSAMLAHFKPDAVLCCASWSWVDGCEGDPAKAFLRNRDEPLLLAEAARDHGARFVYFSTSYVFDGKDGPYSEEAAPNPIGVYGRSKLEAENAVAGAAGGGALIVRTMGVYGEEPQRKNFVYQVLRNLREGRRMKVPSDQFGNATHAAGLATGVVRLLEGGHRGIWNIAGPDPCLCRRDFALRIAREYSLDPALFDFLPTAELHQPAPRPLQGGLKPDKAVEKLGLVLRDWVRLHGE